MKKNAKMKNLNHLLIDNTTSTTLVGVQSCNREIMGDMQNTQQSYSEYDPVRAK